MARDIERRLLDEFGDGVRGAAALAATNVAVTGLRRVRDDPEGDELALLGELRADGRGLLEGSHVAHHVVRGRHQKHGLGIGLLRLHGGYGHRRCRVLADGLEQYPGRRHGQRADLLRHREPMRLVAHDDGGAGALDARQPHRRLLQHGLLPGERQQLLGIHFSGQRPKPGPGAPGKNHRSQTHGTFTPGCSPRPIA